MTRWHENDLGGRLLNAMHTGKGDNWTVLNLPALAQINDPMGREVGEPLWPAWQNIEDLARIREAVGPRAWGSLYQQDPRPPEGSLFKHEHLLVNGWAPEYPKICDGVYAVIDSAVKTGSKNDGTAVTYFAVNKILGNPLLVLDWDIVQIEGSLLEQWLPSVFQRLDELAKECRARLGVAGVWIEDKASGTILLQQAKRRGLKVYPIESKLTGLGKEERALNVTGYVERGDVKISRIANDKMPVYKGVKKNHLLSQVVGFRLGARDRAADDLLDTFTYGIAIALGNLGGF